jgi:hypothetical protein
MSAALDFDLDHKPGNTHQVSAEAFESRFMRLFP